MNTMSARAPQFLCKNPTCCTRWRELRGAFKEGRREEVAREVLRTITAGEYPVGCFMARSLVYDLYQGGYIEHAVAPYPHLIACEKCRQPARCNHCGKPVPSKGQRCTQGRCLQCCTGAAEHESHQ